MKLKTIALVSLCTVITGCGGSGSYVAPEYDSSVKSFKFAGWELAGVTEHKEKITDSSLKGLNHRQWFKLDRDDCPSLYANTQTAPRRYTFDEYGNTAIQNQFGNKCVETESNQNRLHLMRCPKDKDSVLDNDPRKDNYFVVVTSGARADGNTIAVANMGSSCFAKAKAHFTAGM